jgi:hypothetical protein
MANKLFTTPKIKNPGTAAAMITMASSQLGYSETGNNDTAFGRWYGLNNQPWCAIFISWAAAKSGCGKVIPKHAYTPAGAAWFKSRKQWGNKPRVGAIVYYDTSGLGRISHVGVVDKVFSDGSWTSIEGNTNSAGSREGRVVRRQKRRTTGKLGGFGYPKYAAAPTKAAPKKADTKPAPSKTPAKKSVQDVAREIVEGKWGNGVERKARIQRAGYNYNQVQDAVNAILKRR